MKYYCLGIKGAGMSTLASILYDLGNDVVGYDDVKDYKFTEEGLNERGIKIYTDSSNPLEKDRIVTHSVALKSDHAELVRCKENGLTIKKYSKIMGELTEMFKSICVSGTHGKTTTSTLIKTILDEVYKVNYFIGDGTGHATKDNEYFVIESDEFNRHFLDYSPYISVVTNIELEHTEIYRDIEDIIETFEKFVSKTSDITVACGDNENVRKINFKNKVIFYGFNENNDVYAKDVKYSESGIEFDVYKNKEFFHHFNVPLYGSHMVLNTLAAIIVCDRLGVKKEKIEQCLKNFKNAKRRFAIETVGDNVIIDDYAHHPTEIEMTLKAARQKYKDKELIAIFKPNTYSRTQKFYKEFADSLNIADKVYLTEIDCNREKKADYGNVTSKVIFDLLKNGEMIKEGEEEKLTRHKNAVICFMSCASIAHLKDNYKKLLK